MLQVPLTNSELLEKAPSLFTREPHQDASDKYHFIPTIDVVEEIRANNWYPVSVSEAGVKDYDRFGYQRHLVRFRHFEDLLYPKENAVELLLFNSHDRSTSFFVSAGVYRFVCSNGLVVAENEFESYKIKHIGKKESEIVDAIEKITSIKPTLMQKIDRFESIKLNESEKESFARLAVSLRFEEHLEINCQDLLIPHRKEDEKSDLYTVMNVIQENLIRGNISGVNKKTKRRFTSKKVTSISKDVKINKGLWSIAEKIAQIKDLAA